MANSDNSPDSEEQAKVIEGHVADGIEEYDNPLPRWWSQLFYATIVFAVAYSAYYLPGFGLTKEEEYLAARLEYDSLFKKEDGADAPTSEVLISYARNADHVAAGLNIFVARCVVCHGAEGQGFIGPNLTDDYWIHGASLDNIYAIIRDGVPEKGMLAWKDQLSVEEMAQVTAYVRSIQETQKPGKDPEGEKSSPTELGSS